MVSLLNIIENQLETNLNVTIIRKEEELNFQRQITLSAPKPLKQDSHRVWYHIAPTIGLYTADELDIFMKMLVPNLKPDHYLSPYEDKSKLAIQWQYFTENIGIEKITVAEELELFDIEMASEGSIMGLEDGKRKTVNTYELIHQRKIFIKTYPDAVLAKDMLEGKFGANKDSGTRYQRDIPKEALYNTYLPDNHCLKPKKKQGLLARLFS
ncbi:MAG: hypothetical protein AABY40_03840 [Nanoarchaeota archaeon]